MANTTLDGSNSTGLQLTYLWSTSNGTFVSADLTQSTVVVSSEGTYNLTVTDKLGNTSTESFNLLSELKPNINIDLGGAAPVLNLGNTSITLTAISDISGTTFSWTPGGSTSSSINVTTSGTYKVTGTPPSGCSASSSIHISGNSSVDNIPPSIPIRLEVSNASGTTADLTWEPSVDNVGVTGYEVEVYGNSPIVVPTNSINLTGLNTGFSKVKVRAFDAAGNYSDWSYYTYIIIPDNTAPSIPDYSTFYMTENHYILNWDASTDDSNETITYKVYRSGDLFGTSTENSILVYPGIIATSYVTGVWTIVACDKYNNCSLPSEEWVHGITGVPDSPDEVYALNYSGNTWIRVEWNYDTPQDILAYNYEIWRKVNGSSYYKVANSNSNSYIDSSAVGYNNYCYKIKAVSSMGSKSDYSLEACIFNINDDSQIDGVT